MTASRQTQTAVDKNRLHDLLHDLINIYSPSGKEAEVVDYVEQFLAQHGQGAVRQTVAEGRDNLICLADTDGQQDLAFIGHLDTVSTRDLEAEPEEEDDTIYGLGAADMKGGCAAMIEAFIRFQEKHGHMPDNSALALVVGEEEEGDGSRELLKEYRFPWAVIGEPTELKPCLANYSYLEVELTARGKRLHASMSSQVRNPVVGLLQTIVSITRYLDRECPDIICNIRDVWSSQAGFVVPEYCEGFLDLHIPPDRNIADIMHDIEELFTVEILPNRKVESALQYVTVDSGFELPEKGALVEAMQAIFKSMDLDWSPTPFISHSDANQLWQAGTRPILLGPGELEKAHARDESVPFQQVADAASVYLQLIEAFEN